MLVIVVLLLNACFVSSLNTCNMLCVCENSQCTSCFSDFEASQVSQSQITCECPTGFYLADHICQFCPLNCLECTSLTDCTSCEIGYVLNSGKCDHHKYIEGATWLSYHISHDFKLSDTNTYSMHGFSIAGENQISSAEFIQCNSLTYDDSYQIQQILKFEKNTPITFKRKVYGLPFHNWVRVSMAYVALDTWNGQALEIKVVNTEAFKSIAYDNSQRYIDICGGNEPDNLGRIDLRISNMDQNIELQIVLQANVALGIKEIIYEAGTCPRNCITCSDADTCSYCADNYLLQNGICLCDPQKTHQTHYGCLQKCKEGYVFLEDSLDRCVLCQLYLSHCNSCQDTQICTSCHSYAFLYEGKCIEQCGPGTYPITNYDQSKLCQQCPQNCDTCLSQLLCLTCDQGFLNNAGVCVDICPNQLSESNPKHCLISQACISGCQSCDNNNQCIICNKPYWLYQNQCISSCPITTYPEISTSLCKKCPQQCFTCFDEDICLTCTAGLILREGKCINYGVDCPHGKYYDARIVKGNGKCIDCPPGCKRCYKGLCYSCFLGYFLDNGKCLSKCSDQKAVQEDQSHLCLWKNPICHEYDQVDKGKCSICRQMDYDIFLTGSGVCTGSCPTNFISSKANRQCLSQCVSNCKICENDSECILCNSGFVLDSNLCVENCPAGTFSDAFQCIKCQTNCENCDITGNCLSWKVQPSESCSIISSNCHRCFLTPEQICVECDQNSYLQNGQCITSCSMGNFKDQISRQCRQCKPNCEECSNFQTCTKCSNGFFQHQAGCLKACPNGFYNNVEERQCQKCSQTCKTCYGPKKYQCLSCFMGYKMDHTECVVQCPIHRYQDPYEHCDWCHQSCKYCYGPADFQCIECETQYYVYKGECFNQCPSATYIAEPAIRKCEDCSWGCAICDSPSYCITCFGGFYLIDGYCENSCPAGTFYDSNNNICTTCSMDNCQSCSELSCHICNQGFYLYNGKCTDTCPPGWYALDSYFYLACMKCSEGCTSCSAYYSCQICQSDYILKNGKCVHDCPANQFFQNGQCSFCLDNCQICYSQNSCTKCQNGYYYDPQTPQCTSQCPSNTYPDQSSNNWKCTSCSTQCLQCSSFFSCEICLDGYTLKNGICYQDDADPYDCSVSNCDFCPNSAECTQCEKQYYLTEQKQCQPTCPTNTYQYLDQCYPCSERCLVCNQNQCTQCETNLMIYLGVCVNQCPDGFYTADSKCILCPDTCQTCNSAGQCTSCTYPFVKVNDVCEEACPASTYYSLSAEACMQCGQNCLICLSLSRCTTCSPTYILNIQTGKCEQGCSKGTFLDYTSNNCQKCVFECDVCISQTECQSCKSGFYLYEGQCRIQCPNQYFENYEMNICEQCGHKCLTCEYAANQCTSCPDNLYLFETSCVNQCPEGTYPYQINRECLPCSDYCINCLSNSQCNQCHPLKVLYSGNCIDSCPSGSYNQNGICQECFQPCQKCSGGSQYECQSCLQGYYLYATSCIEECPTGYYPDLISRSCRACQEDCLECIEFSHCTICVNGVAPSNGQCQPEEKCDPNTQANCQHCQNSECDQCFDGYYLENGKCVSDCKTGSYEKEISGECSACSQNCVACQDHDKCSECSANYILYEGSCFIECPEGTIVSVDNANLCVPDPCLFQNSNTQNCEECVLPYLLSDGNCVINCPAGTYPSQLKCLPCQSSCKTCFNVHQCNQCSQGYYEYSNKCFETCPSGTYKDESNLICEDCSINCLLCSFRNTMETCTQCTKGFYLQNGECTTICDDGTYPDQFSGSCSPCSLNCEKCLTQSNCIDCLDNFYLFNGQCVSECPQGYYKDTVEKICKKCSGNCAICTASEQCEQCNDGYLINDENCVESCPSGTYPKNSQSCAPCTLTSCLQCQSINQCTQCSNDMVLYDSDCVSSCPDGYYKPATDNVCQKCDQLCLKCEEVLDKCTQCYNGYVLVNNYCRPKCQSNQYQNAEECQNCPQRCVSCINQNHCTSCQTGFVLYEGLCIQNCPAGYEPINNICKSCIDHCNSCLQEDCLECENGYYLVENDNKQYCVNTCPPGTYKSDKTCEECGEQCATCKDQNSCTSCPQQHYLTFNEHCTNSCPSGTYPDGQICRQCTPNCELCKDIGNCQDCDSQFYELNGQCVQQCPPGTYQNLIPNTCEQCNQQYCIECSGSGFNECTSCQNAYILNGICNLQCPAGYKALDGRCIQVNPQQCTEYIIENVCYEYCISGYYESNGECKPCSPNCEVCLNYLTCQICQSPAKLHDGLCVNFCPLQHINVEGVCIKCTDENCNNCENTAINCVQCNTGYILHNSQCVLQCTKGFYSNQNKICEKCPDNCASCLSLTNCQQCINSQYSPPDCADSQCGSNQYLNLNSQCDNCNSECLTCYGGAVNNCLTCQGSLILIQGQCRSSCPSSYFYNSAQNSCYNCPSSCKTCENADKCTQCISNYILYEDYCIIDCEQLNSQSTSYYFDGTSCLPCPDNCIQCSSPSCTVCQDGSTLNDGQCTSTCPVGQFESLNKCTSCSQNCLNCVSYDGCQQCENDFYLYNNYCVQECLPGTYPKVDICEPCSDPRCLQCISQSQCSYCLPPFSVLNGQSCQQCIDGYIYDVLTKTCISCSQQCLTCQDNYGKCTSCPPSFYLFNGDCLSSCPVGYYQKEQQCVQCSQQYCAKCDSTDCIQCLSGFFKDTLGNCVDNCPAGTYKDLALQTCENCQDNCQLCTEIECTQCKNGYSMHKDKCIQNCPIGTVDIDGSCEDCSEGCRVCSSQYQCTECRSDYNLKEQKCEKIICPYGTLQLADGSCIQSCPDSTVYNQEALSCDQCPQFCLTCNVEGQCQSCTTSNYLYLNLCYEQCPTQTYSIDFSCVDCPIDCSACESDTFCTLCKANRFLHNDMCEQSCPPKYFEDVNVCSACSMNCIECSSTSQCTNCEGSFVLYGGQCKQACPTNTYQEGKQCFDCIAPCVTCKNSQECVTCLEDFSVNADKECVNDCGAGFYQHNGQCTECVTSKCQKCKDEVCFECFDGYYLYVDENGIYQCTESCPTGYYKQEEQKMCIKCVEPCIECVSIDQCQVCESNFYLHEKQCVEKCPQGTYISEKQCLNCIQNCKKCETSSTCQECSDSFVKHMKTEQSTVCVEKCPQKYFEFEEENLCQKCGENCLTCQDADTCLSCISLQYEIINGTCIHQNCLNCDQCVNQACQECSENYYLLQQKCYSQCPSPFYGDNVNKTCEGCMENCIECHEIETCDLCIEGYNFSINECVDEAFMEYGIFANMSGFTSNITQVMAAVYIGTSLGPVAFGEMSTTYFNIELCQFILFHGSAAGDNPEVQQFLDSLQSMSLSLSNGNNQQETSRRRMLESVLTEPQAFLAVNALIFILAGAFGGIYLLIYIFQKNVDKCCGSCPKLFFIVNQICIFMQQRFKWIYFDFIMWLAYIPFLYFAMKQLVVFPFDTFLQIISSLLSLVIIMTFPTYPFFIAYLIHKNYNAIVKKDNRLVEMSLMPFIDKVKRPESVVPENQSIKQFITFENIRLLVDAIKYFRKLLFIIVIIVSYQNPIVTLSVLTGLNVMFIIYLFVFRPREMPYLIFDFIIEFLLLGFEIFMLVYLCNDGAKISAMSIVTHAIGFITANLSLFVAIILNLVAYYKIIMCLRELYLHLKQKLEEKEKQEMKNSDEDKLSSNIKNDEKQFGLHDSNHIGGSTELDQNEDHRRGLMEDKQLFDIEGHERTDSHLNNSMKLKSSSKVNKRKNKDKQLNSIPMKRKRSNELTDQEIQSQGPSDLIKKNKEIFYDEDGNIIKVQEGELPNLHSTKHKKKKHPKNKDSDEFNMDKELDHPKLRKYDDDEITEEDPELSQGGSNLIKDKDLFGNDSGYIRQSIGGEIPGLKQSGDKKVNKKLRPIQSDEDSFNHSILSDEHLIDNGTFKNRQKDNPYKRSIEDTKNKITVTNGTLKEKDKGSNKYMREIPTNLKKIESKNQSEDENIDELGFKERLNKGQIGDELKEGQFRERNTERKNKKQQENGEVESGKFTKHNTQRNNTIKEGQNLQQGKFNQLTRNKKGQPLNTKELEEVDFNDRNQIKKLQKDKETDLQQARLKNRQKANNQDPNNAINQAEFKEINRKKKNNLIDAHEDKIQSGKFTNKIREKGIPDKKQQQEKKIQQAKMKERERTHEEEWDDFLDEANLKSQNSKKKQTNIDQGHFKEINKKTKSKDKESEPFDLDLIDRAIPDKTNSNKKDSSELQNAKFHEQNQSKKNKDGSPTDIHPQQGNAFTRTHKKKDVIGQLTENYPKKQKDSSLDEATMYERERKTKKQQIEREKNVEVPEGLFTGFKKSNQVNNSGSSNQNEDVKGGVVVERKGNKFKRNVFGQNEDVEEIKQKSRDQKDQGKKRQGQFQLDDVDDVFFSEASPEMTKQKKKVWGEDNIIEGQYQRRPGKEKVQSKQKDGGLHLHQSQDINDDTYSNIKRKHKQELRKMEPGKNNMFIDGQDQFQDSDYERPPSAIERPGSRGGKGHLSIHGGSDFESDDSVSIRRKRQHSKSKVIKRGNLNLDEKSEYSGDSDVSRPGKSKQKKYKRKQLKSGHLDVVKQDNDGDEGLQTLNLKK